jgi:transposase-like protein
MMVKKMRRWSMAWRANGVPEANSWEWQETLIKINGIQVFWWAARTQVGPAEFAGRHAWAAGTVARRNGAR